jgi:DNA-binding beta-propeller fold protein YncE
MQDGAMGSAAFANPVSVLLDDGFGVLVCDFDNDRIRRIDNASGTVSTLTSQAGFQRPFGLALAPDGALYAHTDYDPSGAKGSSTGTIWRIDPLTGAPTVTASDLGRPRGLAALADGRLVLADYQNARVRLLDPTDGTVTDLAGRAGCPGLVNGHGADARFAVPYGVVALPAGDIVVADYGNHVLRRVTMTGDVSPYAGDGGSGTIDGPRLGARFAGPKALAIDGAGNIYVSDSESHRIRRVGADGNVSTLAGDGAEGFRDGPGATSEFYGQEGISVSPDGRSLYVADGSAGEDVLYHRIRMITLAP